MARRRGAFSITAALLIIGLIATTTLVIFFIMNATRSVVSTPSVSVVGNPTLQGDTLYFTLKVITGDVDPASISVVGASSTTCTAAEDNILQCTATFTTPPSSDQVIARTPGGEISIPFTRI